jgi:hypothetical protein
MTVGIGAGGFIGVAHEVTPGTYVAPSKYFPITSENLQFVQDTQWRRVLRQVADNVGPIQGNVHVEGDIELECLTDALPWLLRASRQTVVKTGAGPYTYTFTPSHAALPPDKTLSITVVRAGVVHGFVGCSVASFAFSVDNGVATFKCHVVGMDEATQTLPSATFSTLTPGGAGQYSIQIPTASAVNDVDTFNFEVNDNLEPQFRLRALRTPAFMKFGERTATLSIERDFDTRAELDAFKALTSTSVTVQVDKGASDRVTIKVAGGVRESYVISALSGQGDLIRATIGWQGVYDPATSKAYEIIVITPTETVP